MDGTPDVDKNLDTDRTLDMHRNLDTDKTPRTADDDGCYAVFGGSFDPPHVAHIQVVKWLLGQPGIDGVVVVPCFSHAFGKTSSPFADRLEMCRIAFADLGPRVEVSDIESTLPQPSYTVNTIVEMARRQPARSFRLVIGSDIPAVTSKWHDFDRLSRLAPPILVNRGGQVIAPDAPVFPRVSSSDIRRRIAAGLPCDQFFTKEIAEYVSGHNLYKTSTGMPSPGVVIVGCGRVGTALALTFHKAGLPVSIVDQPDVLERRVNIPATVARFDCVANVDLSVPSVWFVCVGDASVPGTVRNVTSRLDADLDIVTVTSATAPIDCGTSGVPVCRTHPLRAFPPADSAAPLRDKTVFAVSDAPAPLVTLLHGVRCRTFTVDDAHADLYHAAAVVACNLPGALLFQATAMLRACGVPEPEQAAIGLLADLVDNVTTGGITAVSGPAARGDAGCVARDQAAAGSFDERIGQVHAILAGIIYNDIFGHGPSGAGDDKQGEPD